MALYNKSFVASYDTITKLPDALSVIDSQVNEFMKDKHWSQVRDILQITAPTSTPSNLPTWAIIRTLVLVTETLASGRPAGAAASSVSASSPNAPQSGPIPSPT